MKVLLITPYSPLLRHDHAANDLSLPFVKALAPFVELHVYAPGQVNSKTDSWMVDGVVYHAGSPVQRKQIDRIGRYPFAARGSWSRRSTAEVNTLLRKLRPAILHAEYFQTAEPLLGCAKSVKTSITLHDVTVEVPSAPRFEESLLRRSLRTLERVKTKRAMDAVLNRVDALFVFSEHDKRKVSKARGVVEVAPVGLVPPVKSWKGGNSHVAVFGGAMWRYENEITAIYLVNEVLPLVRRKLPDAELRIFGARPTVAVQELGSKPGVTVVGEVMDYEGEFQSAAVTLAPTLVEAGILLKAIRAMSIGAPVVLNSASAVSIDGLVSGVHALVADSPVEYAAQVVQLMQDRESANRIGKNARDLVLKNFDWNRTADAYIRIFEQLIKL